MEAQQERGKFRAPDAALPELFGVKHQFHIVDDRWQVFQRRPLQTKTREER